MQEQKIIRKVTGIGNGAHIFAPKDWINEDVVITLIPKIDIKQEIIKELYPYLDKISGVYLYGSYARNEQKKDSDIDILVIAKEKFNIKKYGFDIIILKENTIKSAIKINPILMYSIIKESKSIINSQLLETLKKIKINKNDFNQFIENTKGILKIDKGILKIDKEFENYAPDSVIYSLILRLKGIFIINTLLKNEKYSNHLFKHWLLKKIPELDYEEIYESYEIIKKDKKDKDKNSMKYAELLIILLEEELKNFDKNDK